MEYAYNNGDISWLAVSAKDKVGFVPSHENVTYIGELWKEEKSGTCKSSEKLLCG